MGIPINLSRTRNDWRTIAHLMSLGDELFIWPGQELQCSMICIILSQKILGFQLDYAVVYATLTWTRGRRFIQDVGRWHPHKRTFWDPLVSSIPRPKNYNWHARATILYLEQEHDMYTLVNSCSYTQLGGHH